MNRTLERLPRHRIRFLAMAVLMVAALSCGREPTGGANSARQWNLGAVQLRFPPAYQQATSTGGIVPIDRVRVLFISPFGRAALDTTIAFGGADSLAVPLRISLDPGWPGGAEPFALSLAFVNVNGDTVFRGGPVTASVTPGANAAAPLMVAVVYTGIGADARAVRISPRTLAVVSGDDFGFTALASDSSGAAILRTPVAWTTLDPSRATLSSPAAGDGRVVGAAGTAQIVGRLLSGPADTVTLFIQPRPPTLRLVSGGGQVATADTRLSLPVVIRVASTDGTGRPGVSVAFNASNGGVVSAGTVTTDANGGAQTLWSLGHAPGTQTMSVTASGATGSPLSVTATAKAATPVDSTPVLPAGHRTATQLDFSASPSAVAAGVPITPGIAVSTLDDSGHIDKDFTGVVSLSLLGAPGASGISGDRTVKAAAGVATFTTIAVAQVGGGFRFVASSGSLRPDTSAAFAVTASVAAGLAIAEGDGQSGAMSVPLVTPLTARVTDAYGNAVSLVSVSFAVATGGGSLSVASVQTSAAGLASTTWTLGPLAGKQTATATAIGVTGPPVVWKATAKGVEPIVPSHLSFVQGPTMTLAGRKMTPPVVVHAVRANGNVDPSFSSAITLALAVNPGGATMTGGTAADVAGSSGTFNSVSLDRAGSGYQLVASAAGVESATSSLFNIVAAAADRLEIASGDGQDAHVSSALAEALAVRATDALGNSAAGVTVTWAVTTGGGRLSAATSTTNVAGIASNTWTLGPSPGAQRVSASAAGLTGSPVGFRAVARQ